MQQIQAQQALAGKSRTTLEKEKEKALRAKEKAEEEKRAKEEAALLKPVQTQKVPFGVDPKTVLCAFFKAGHCDKGNKCKFSHDLNVGRKVEKRNLYEDVREDKATGQCIFSGSAGPCVILACIRYYGQVGRRQAAKSRTFKARKPANDYRCA